MYLFDKRGPVRLDLRWGVQRPFKLTTSADPLGKDFPSFHAARSYADRELAFGEAFVITHTPRGGAWHGQAGIEGEAFQLPVTCLEPATYH